MENYKELYGWNENDIKDLVTKELLPLVPSELSFIDYDPEQSEAIIVHFDEAYMEDDVVPDFVTEYEKRNNNEHYMYHCGGCLNKDEECFTIGVLTTFDSSKRVIFMEVRNEDAEVLFKVNFVK